MLDPHVYKGGRGCRIRTQARREAVAQQGAASAEDFMLVTETILLADAATIAVAGLDGDADELYEIEGSLLVPTTSANLRMSPNGAVSGLKSSIHNETSSTEHGADWRLGTWSGITGYQAFDFRMTLYAARTIGGAARRRRYHFDGQRDGGNFSNRMQGGGVWSDSAANLTFVDFTSSIASGILTGSRVRVYKRTA